MLIHGWFEGFPYQMVCTNVNINIKQVKALFWSKMMKDFRVVNFTQHFWRRFKFSGMRYIHFFCVPLNLPLRCLPNSEISWWSDNSIFGLELSTIQSFVYHWICLWGACQILKNHFMVWQFHFGLELGTIQSSKTIVANSAYIFLTNSFKTMHTQLTKKTDKVANRTRLTWEELQQALTFDPENVPPDPRITLKIALVLMH